MIIFIILLTTNILAIQLIRKKNQTLTLISALFYTLCSIYTFYIYIATTPDYDSVNRFLYQSNPDISVYAICLFLIASTSICVGSTLIRTKTHKLNEIKISSSNNILLFKKIIDKTGWQITLTILSLAYPIINIISYGDEFFQRSGYTPENLDYNAAQLVSIFMFVSAVTTPLVNKNTIRYALLIGLVLADLATTSRGMLITIGFFTLFSIILRNKGILWSTSMAILMIYCTASVLMIRSNQIQGLIPNIIEAIDIFSASKYVLEGFNYLLSYGVGATAFSLESNAVDIHDIFNILDPRPSSMIADASKFDVRINIYSPVPAISYLHNAGILFVVIFYILIGIFCGIVEKILKTNNTGFYFLISVITFCSAALATQYNLRAVSRLLYYSIFLTAMYLLLNKIRSLITRIKG